MTRVLASMHDHPPILICADLQIEYLTEGRRHRISDAEPVMSRCLDLLTLWRNNLWPVMHLKRIAQAAWFNPASNLTDWIAELRPRPGEMAFEHPLPSAYSSTRFTEYMANMKNIRCVLSGFSLDETVLATIVDGFHRSHRYHVVGDAVACRRTDAGEAGSYRTAVLRVIANFAAIEGSGDLIGQGQAARSRDGGFAGDRGHAADQGEISRGRP
jgi:nicotinamidase-related amidase